MKAFLLFCLYIASTFSMYSQAPRYVLIEHFTQASCGPCAAQNPGLESGILMPNVSKVRHIAYHTSWPGVDPMYSHNPSESNARVTYYNVTGVPNVILLGNKKEGLPNAIVQQDVDYWFSAGSPVKIKVSETDNGATRDVTVEVITLSTPPSGNWVVRAAVVEDPINYAIPPGNNGETHFPNVFRKMLPGSSGEPVVFAAPGNSVSFDYTYTEDPAWNTANLKVIAWVQNETTKEVLNSGSTLDPEINYTLSHPILNVAQSSSGITKTFTLSSSNSGSSTEDFIYTLTSDMPANWSSGFDINSVTYTSVCTLSVNAGASNTISLNITPGTSPYVGKFSLSVKSADNPSTPEMIAEVYVMANVTDLIINNGGYIGDGTTQGGAALWEGRFTSGLNFAGNTAYATTSDYVARRLMSNNEFSGVNNIYYNVGWTFPSFSSDAFVTELITFLNSGGNLFIAGQDIGWDIYDIQGNGTAAQQSFYVNYLQALYANDGGSLNTQLTTQTSDAIWGDLPNAAIMNSHGFYSSTHLYPEELNPGISGNEIYRYNSTTKTAGVRSENGTWKTVYIGVGMEQLSVSNAEIILKRAHDWFYGISASTENWNGLELQPNYPNPAGDHTIIPLPGFSENCLIHVRDIQGRLIQTGTIAPLATQYMLSTAEFAPGTYFYEILHDNAAYKRMFTVVH